MLFNLVYDLGEIVATRMVQLSPVSPRNVTHNTSFLCIPGAYMYIPTFSLAAAAWLGQRPGFQRDGDRKRESS